MRRKYFLVFVYILLLGVVVINKGYCIADSYLIEGLELEEYNDGRTIFKVNADKSYIGNYRFGFFQFALKQVVYLENAHITFFDENGKDVLNIDRDMAIFDPSTKNLYDIDGKKIGVK